MSNPEDRPRKIPIQDETLNLQNIKNAPVTFNLGVKPAHSPSEAIAAQHQAAQELPTQQVVQPEKAPKEHQVETQSAKPRLVFGITPPPRPVQHQPVTSVKKQSTAAPRKTSLHNRIWYGLEFLSLTAAIFMIFFLAFNFDSYSQLFISKLNQLRGQVNQNPVVIQLQQNLKNSSPQTTQKPLPIVQNQAAAQKQFPMISLEVAPPDDRVEIPRINQNVPVVRVPTDKLIQRDWAALEGQIQDALRNGVVHFPGTAMPGEHGNVVITGHSSYFPWDPGRFKDVFALLHQVNVGDTIIVYHEQKKYTYKVSDKVVVHPDQVDVLTQNGEDKLTLITCTPVGTALNRLVVTAKPVDQPSS
jgi:sortase A